MSAAGERFNPYRQYNGTFIPEPVARYRGASPGAKMIYGRLYRYAGEDGEVFPSIGALAKECGISESQARAYVQELERGGFIEVDRENHHYRKDGSGGSNRYFFLYHPAFDGETGEKRKTPPLRKTKGVPLRKTEPPPLRKTKGGPLRFTVPEERNKEGHHQERQVKEGQGVVPISSAAEPPAENQKPKPAFESQAVDDDSTPRTPENAERRLKVWAERRGDPFSQVDWWALKAEAEGRGIDLGVLANLAEKNNGKWKSSCAGLRWLIRNCNGKSTEVPEEKPAQQTGKCAKCGGIGQRRDGEQWSFCDCPMGKELEGATKRVAADAARKAAEAAPLSA